MRDIGKDNQGTWEKDFSREDIKKFNFARDDFAQGYQKLWKLFFLSLITFGIYWYIWVYRVTRRLNIDETHKRRSPVVQVVLCIFAPLYDIIWLYRSATRLEALESKNGVCESYAIECLVISIFFPGVATLFIQHNYNKVVAERNKQLHELSYSI